MYVCLVRFVSFIFYKMGFSSMNDWQVKVFEGLMFNNELQMLELHFQVREVSFPSAVFLLLVNSIFDGSKLNVIGTHVSIEQTQALIANMGIALPIGNVRDGG